MVRGVCERSGSACGLSITGIAGPDGGTPTKPVGLVFVGLSSARGTSSVQFSWGGTRQEIQSRTAKLALNRVRLHLMQC